MSQPVDIVCVPYSSNVTTINTGAKVIYVSLYCNVTSLNRDFCLMS